MAGPADARPPRSRRHHAFTWEGLDRASHRRREDGWIEEQLTRPSTLFLPVWRQRNLVVTGERASACLVTAPRLASPREAIFLGLEQERALFAVDLSDDDDPLSRLEVGNDHEFVDLRQIGSLLGDRDGTLLAYARGITTWHREHRFCGRCGAPTHPIRAGHVRRCNSQECGHESFPRTDPAVIMLVTDGERALLGRQPRWPPGFYSTLAGFCEPGETLEAAVAREVREEAGIEVSEASYQSSQPWPFPSSLMLGFVARAEPSEPNIDRDELEDARWFSREELQERRAAREVRLPPRVSIARRLIEGWLEKR